MDGHRRCWRWPHHLHVPAGQAAAGDSAARLLSHIREARLKGLGQFPQRLHGLMRSVRLAGQFAQYSAPVFPVDVGADAGWTFRLSALAVNVSFCDCVSYVGGVAAEFR